MLNTNFDGYDTLTDEEIKIVDEAEIEIKEGNTKSLDDIIEKLK